MLCCIATSVDVFPVLERTGGKEWKRKIKYYAIYIWYLQICINQPTAPFRLHKKRGWDDCLLILLAVEGRVWGLLNPFVTG